jgi:hypothetical protein
MSVKRYCIADVTLDVTFIDGMCELENFAPFEVEAKGEADHEIAVHLYDENQPPVADEDSLEIVSEDIVNQLFLDGVTLIKKTRMREGDPRVMWTFMNRHDFRRADVFLPDSWIDYTGLANAFMFEKMLLHHDSIMLHCALITVGAVSGRPYDMGVAFTAPSQTGKSTQARLWEENRGAEQLNGDRAILRVIGGQVYAYGSPWAGSSAIYVNRRVRLGAIVALFQAKDNEALKLSYSEALQYFLIGTSLPVWDDDLLGMGLDTIEKVLSGVSLVKLGCTPDVRAVEALEAQLVKS